MSRKLRSPLGARFRSLPPELLALHHTRHNEECKCPVCSEGQTRLHGRRHFNGGQADVLRALEPYIQRVKSKRKPAYFVVKVHAVKLHLATGYALSTVRTYLSNLCRMMVDGRPIMESKRQPCPGGPEAQKDNRNPFRAILSRSIVKSGRREEDWQPEIAKTAGPRKADPKRATRLMRVATDYLEKESRQQPAEPCAELETVLARITARVATDYSTEAT